MENKFNLAYFEKEVNAILQQCIEQPDNSEKLKIDKNTPFSEYVFKKKVLIDKLAEQFGLKLHRPILWEYPTIKLLAHHIMELMDIDNLEKKEQSKRVLIKHPPIAIIGMSCRLPGNINSIDEYWQTMLAGTDTIENVPADRWLVDELYDAEYSSGKMNTRFGGFIKDIDLFEPYFFNISPAEAIQMDPQQRLFLEIAWQALEHAGIAPHTLSNSRTGVYAGASMHDYEHLQVKNGQSKSINAYTNMGEAFSAIGARLAYFLGLNGPSFSIDTACSSSMAAIYHACLSLRAGECDLVLAGGVNLILDPDSTIGYSQAHMMAPDGRCKTFDKSANGYVRSEGCGIVVLKLLDKALDDGDTVYAVIKSAVSNQDGASNGITAPNLLAQKSLLEEGLYCADLESDDITLFETHGTGTYIGDPIEVDVINQVYSNGSSKRQSPLILGAIKSQIGHCEAASGVAGLIKAVLALQHGKIPANLNFNQLNPAIELGNVPCKIPTKTMKWPDDGPKRAVVSSYGFTGTNAHVVLENGPIREISDTIIQPHENLFVLSAKSQQSLSYMIKNFLVFLEKTDEMLPNICYTLATGRSHFAYRIAIECKTIQEVIDQLKLDSLVYDELTLIDEMLKSKKMLELKEAYLQGVNVDWEHYYRPYKNSCMKIALPSYCFNKSRYWIEEVNVNKAVCGDSIHELTGAKIPGHAVQTRYLNQLDLKNIAYLKQHWVHGHVIFPGAAFIETVLAGWFDLVSEAAIDLTDFKFNRPLLFSEGEKIEYQITFDPQEDRYEGVIETLKNNSSEWIVNCSFSVGYNTEVINQSKDLSAIKSAMTAYNKEQFYSDLNDVDLCYGELFQTITEIYFNEKSIFVELNATDVNMKDYVFHPTLLDGAFQAVNFSFDSQNKKSYIPFSLGEFTLYHPIANKVFCHVNINHKDSESIFADIDFYDNDGLLLGCIKKYNARVVNKSAFNKTINHDALINCYVDSYEEYELVSDEKNFKMIFAVHANDSSYQTISGNYSHHSWEKISLNEENSYLNKHVLFVYDSNFNELLTLCRKFSHNAPLSFTLLTHHAVALTDKEIIKPQHTQALGFWKTYCLENTELKCNWIDADESVDLSGYFSMISSKDLMERQLVIRDKVYVPRLLSLEYANKINNTLLQPEKNQYLTVSKGTSTLSWQDKTRKTTADNDVTLEIKATAINFRDVLKSMDLYPGDAGDFGYECAGVVLNVGKNVKKINEGDRVVVFGFGLFGKDVTVDASQVVVLPSVLSFEQAASIPLVFLTANYALNKLAQLKKGQKILIHAATGGVGLAAIQLAQLNGAEVYATTSHLKQEYLKNQLGIKHVYDSRSTHFAQQLLDDTDGQGVDFVLNSLTGSGFIDASLSCLKTKGVFIEISKINTYSPDKMKQVRPDIQYSMIELDERMKNDAPVVQQELADLINLFNNEQLSALPLTYYPIERTVEAFDYLKQAKHIGKVVITYASSFQLDSKSTYLITGGTGGLGFELACHLIQHGVKHIALISRSEPSNKVTQWMRQHEKNAVFIQHYSVDICDKDALAQVFNVINASDYPMRGIFHTAGVIHDGFFNTLTHDDFEHVFAPKITGTINLYQLSQTLALDCFVLFSSITSLLGNVAQTNYAAANAFMDGFAHLARQQGVPAISINWGPFGDVGMAKLLNEHYRVQGVRLLKVEQAFSTLFHCLDQHCVQVAIIDNDWDKLSIANKNYLNYLVQKKTSNKSGWISLLESIAEEKRNKTLVNKLKELIANVLCIDNANTLDVEKGFFTYGVDSLSAVEIKNRIQQELGEVVSLSNTLIFDFPNIKQLSDHLINELTFDVVPNEEIIVENFEAQQDIAIIGMSCEFPGAENLKEFWQLLIENKDGISEIPLSRWNIDDYYDPAVETPGKMITRRGGFINDIELFDNNFFNISTKEAEYLDPQQRLLLTHSWLALEHSGIAAKSLMGSNMGVFVGMATNDYHGLIHERGDDAINAYLGSGNLQSTASGRISFTLGLQGPSLTIDTACSSSLVALNDACERLQRGDCDSAIVAGVSALISPELFINFSKAGMLSPDGSCKTFDAKANGYVRGEGCGVVIIKRLSDALRDNDTVLTVIKASGINQDGASSGLTVPNGQAQERLLQNVLNQSHLTAADIDYIECHGTGTSLGDPIEVNAIGKVYNDIRHQPLQLGSVKTNIGHLEGAAGIAGLIKVVLSLQNKIIPAHRNFSQLNPHINLNFDAQIVRKNKPWQKEDGLRHAALSSFGFSGTNAHVILEQSSQQRVIDESVVLPDEYLFVLSAKTEKSLALLVEQYIDYLHETEDLLSDVCYSAAVCRNHFSWRIAFIVSNKAELLKKLNNDGLTLIETEPCLDSIESTNLKLLSSVYLTGGEIDWVTYFTPYEKALLKVKLPTYQFDKQSLWLEKNTKKRVFGGKEIHPLLGVKIPGFSKVTSYLNLIDLTHLTYLSDHVLFDEIIYPGAAFIEGLFASAFDLMGNFSFSVTAIDFQRPLRLSEKAVDCQITLEDVDDSYHGTIYSPSSVRDEWNTHVEFILKKNQNIPYELVDLSEIKNSLLEVDVRNIYKKFNKMGLDYGSSFQSIINAYSNDTSTLVEINNTAIDRQGYYFHPSLLDGVFQAVVFNVDNSESQAFVPSSIQKLSLYQQASSRLWAYVTQIEKTSVSMTANIHVYDTNGLLIAEIHQFHARLINRQAIIDSLTESEEGADCYLESYQAIELPQLSGNSNLAVEVLSAQLNVSNKSLFCESEWPVVSIPDSLTVTGHHVVYDYNNDFSQLVTLVKRLINNPPLSFTLVTHHAFSVNGAHSVSALQRQAVGLWRTMRLEESSFPCYLIDVNDLDDAVGVIECLCNKLLNENQLILRDELYVPRLVNKKEYEKQQLTSPTKTNYLVNSHGIDSLCWGFRDSHDLKDNQVKIRIESTALNFRDVLKSMALYPGDAGDFGYECAGRISATGDKVKGYEVNDKVIALGQGLFGGEVVVNKNQLVALPSNLSFSQGASIPIVFLTANYGLNILAEIKPGQKVLIHAACGGVGLAAIEFAKLKGAEIYATASHSKQAYLKEKLGITHVYDSRNTRFGEQIMIDTDGKGVDVVLNSLTSEGFIDSSLLCLKLEGIFLEIGKLNIYSQEKMKGIRPDIAYHVIEIDSRMINEPELINQELTEILDLFSMGKLTPLPLTQYTINQIKDAFYFLQHAQHIGKVVINNPCDIEYSNEGTYLITGGTGSLARYLVGHLAEKGVKHFALLSRNLPDKTTKTWLEQQLSHGIIVTHYKVDVANLSDLATVFKTIEVSNRPLKGIFHTAGVLSDGMLGNLSSNDFDKVCLPKVEGSLNLATLSEKCSLDCFVFFSSIVSLLGHLGQANYAAANAFMDGLACQLQQQGVPAVSINWGPFSKIGMASKLTSQHSSQGLNPLLVEQAFDVMDECLRVTHGQLMIANIDWQKYSDSSNSYLSELVTDVEDFHRNWRDLLIAIPPENRLSVMVSKIKQLLAAIINHSEPETIASKQGFFDLGLDSLMSIEFKNKLQQQLGDEVKLANSLVFDYANIEQLSNYLMTQLDFPIKSSSTEQVFHHEDGDDDIVIVGMSGVFPGADNLEEYWKLLINNEEGISDVPVTRWDNEQYYDPDPNALGKVISKRGGFIHDIDKFDHTFFTISAKEAKYLDPQQRLLLKHTWLALENAGIAHDSLSGSDTGVFIGLSTSDYQTLIDKYGLESDINAYIGSGNLSSTASGRISYLLGLQGPCMAIDTACSSSLVALNEACERLQHGQCSSAIVGGVNAILSPELSINFSKAGMLSPDGSCKTFDENANGYVRGEGCGVVIIKRLSDAVKDNDNVLAVIKASGINQDGASSGLTVPSGQAQERLLKSVLNKAKLNAQDIDYIECHGTGTSLGDPIEVNAINNVYKGARKNPLFLGSVKTNIGHLEAAAGIAGLIKVVLSMQHEMIPAHRNFSKLNPHINLDFDAQVITENKPWKKENSLRHAALSSFGFSGTNAHVILEQPSEKAVIDESVVLPDTYLFVLSAKTENALLLLTEQYKDYLLNCQESLSDICYSLTVGRNHFQWRLALKVKTVDEIISEINDNKLNLTKTILIEQLVQSSDLDELIQGYLLGKAIDWEYYYLPYQKALNKASLLSYPLNEKSHWLNLRKLSNPLSDYEQLNKESSNRVNVKQSDLLLTKNLAKEERRERISQIITAHLSDVFGENKSEIEKDIGFFSMGMDSLMAVDLRNRLQQEIGDTFELPTSIALDCPSVGHLVNYFDDLLSNKQSHAEIITLSDYQHEPIAVIGVHGVFPGSCQNPDLLWQLLENNDSAIEEIPLSRWNIDEYYSGKKDSKGKMYVRQGGFVHDVDLFDADFFNISPREAKFIDPQQRLLLQCAWHALEDSGIAANDLKGSNTGVIIGASQMDYGSALFHAANDDYLGMYLATGSVLSAIAGRIAYALDLHGPAMAVDTACSSSLVAVHNACEALRGGNADLMLAGGVNLTLSPEINVALCQAHMLADDGYCKSFDASANGYSRSEGFGVVVLKRLSDAINDGDSIAGVIKASSVNQDGASSGLTVPNKIAQQNLMQLTLAKAGLKANDIQYVEAHGTGTALGDPIEVAAIQAVYGQARDDNNPLVISSIKSNIGHMEAAAGIGGLIKVLQSMKHQIIPGNCHLKDLNPNIVLDNSSIVISPDNQQWSASDKKVAAISSFGFTGTNAHAIIESPPIINQEKISKVSQPLPIIFVLSAKTKQSLLNQIKQYYQYLQGTNDSLSDICFTAATGRCHLSYRIALEVSGVDELRCQLNDEKLMLCKVTQQESIVQSTENKVVMDSYLEGKAIDWGFYYQQGILELTKVKLPLYCFDRKSHWIDINQPIENNSDGDFVSLQNKLSINAYVECYRKFTLKSLSELPRSNVVIYSRTNKLKKFLSSIGGNEKFKPIQNIKDLMGFDLSGKVVVFLYENNFEELVELTRSLFNNLPKKFVLMTKNAVSIDNKQLVNPSHCQAMGFWKSYSLEMINLDCYHVDVSDYATGLNQLVTLLSQKTSDKQFIIRDEIYLPRLTHLDDKMLRNDVAMEPHEYDGEGTYLITGGADGLGIELAKHLITRGVKSLLITSRHEPNKKVTSWITQQIEKDIQVYHFKSDVCNEKSMRQLFNYITTKHLNLKGIFHTAGVIKNGLLLNLSDTDFNSVLAPKVLGSSYLDEMSRCFDLDCFVLFSSLATVLGSPGQTNYSAANAFMDGLAHKRHQQGLVATSVNSVPFANVSMAANLENYHKEKGVLSIRTDSAFELMDMLLSTTYSQVCLASIEWEKLGNFITPYLENFISMDVEEEQSWAVMLEMLSLDKKVSCLQQQLKLMLVAIVGIENLDEINVDKDFFEMGMDSLMAMEILNTLQKELLINLPVNFVFNYSTINQIVEEVLYHRMDSNLIVPAIEYDTINVQCLKHVDNASINFLIFPPLGFGVNAFDSWVNLMPPNMNLWIVGLEGMDDLNQLSDAILLKLEPLSDLPLLVYGHSFGGLVAFEVLKKASQDDAFNIKAFYPSASITPDNWCELSYNKDSAFSRLSSDLDEKLIMDALIDASVLPDLDKNNFLSNKEIKNQVKSILDYKLTGGKLNCPIIAIHPKSDVLVSFDDSVGGWESWTTSSFHFQSIDDGHLYCFNPSDDVIKKIIDPSNDI